MNRPYDWQATSPELFSWAAAAVETGRLARSVDAGPRILRETAAVFHDWVTAEAIYHQPG